jgi:hypothetical protein
MSSTVVVRWVADLDGIRIVGRRGARGRYLVEPPYADTHELSELLLVLLLLVLLVF